MEQFKKLLFLISTAYRKTEQTNYTIQSSKVSKDRCFVILSDIHDDIKGKRFDALLQQIDTIAPDFIIMPGDIFNERGKQEETIAFIKQLQASYPCIYSCGNHEKRRWDFVDLMQQLLELGIYVVDLTTINKVLDDDFVFLGISGSKHNRQQESIWFDERDGYRILLSHFPNDIALYNKLDCDLVVSGHAHGGQWRIPYLKQPIYSPGEGLLPKYAQGIHELHKKHLIVSRGLVRHYHGIPRFFNNPEILVVHIKKNEQ